tara:strand:- start:74 stop:487 length:414 start_codon:yes stop_codon:yes gene_type:complete
LRTHGNTGETGIYRIRDRIRADRWHIGANLLAGLWKFHQNATAPFAAQPAATLKQPARAFRRLKAEYDPVLDYRSLADVQMSHGVQHTYAMCDVIGCPRIGLETAEGPFGRTQFVQDGGRTDNPKSLFLLKGAHDGP